MSKPRSPPVFDRLGNMSIFDVALQYLRYGWNVLPLHGKRPSIRWRAFQQYRVSEKHIQQWYRSGLFGNIGIVCGAVSNNLVILDVDSEQGYQALKQKFPNYISTYTVRTGSGVGYHLYWHVEQLPQTIRVKTPNLGNLELLSSGCQAVAPPSIHPKTDQPYHVAISKHILTLERIGDLCVWLNSLRKPKRRKVVRLYKTTADRYTTRNQMISTLTNYFVRRGYTQNGMWLNGSCIYPRRHRNNDRHPSFGFNTQSGFGHCFVCGTLSPEEICDELNIMMR